MERMWKRREMKDVRMGNERSAKMDKCNYIQRRREIDNQIRYIAL